MAHQGNEPKLYWGRKQCFAKYMSLYFVKDLIQGFSLEMKFEFQRGNEA